MATSHLLKIRFSFRRNKKYISHTNYVFMIYFRTQNKLKCWLDCYCSVFNVERQLAEKKIILFGFNLVVLVDKSIKGCQRTKYNYINGKFINKFKALRDLFEKITILDGFV